MDTSALVQYVSEEKSKGTPIKFIYEKSLSSGWGKETIAQVVNQVYGVKPANWNFLVGGFSDYIEGTFKFFGANSRLFLMISAVPAVAGVLIWILQTLLYPGVLAKNLPLYISLPSNIIYIAANFLATMALLYAVTNIENNPDFKSSVKGGLSKIWPFFLTSLISFLAIVAGSILLIIPGFIIAVYIIFDIYLVYTENLSGLAAVKRSYFYVKGYFLTIIGRLFAISATLYVFRFLLGLVIGFAGLKTIITPISAIAESFFMTLPVIYTYLLYVKIKEIKTVYNKPPVSGTA